MRTLEDLDMYFRSDPSLIVIKDKDAISSKRPLKYIEKDNAEMHVLDKQDAEILRRSSKVGNAQDFAAQHREIGD